MYVKLPIDIIKDDDGTFLEAQTRLEGGQLGGGHLLPTDRDVLA